MSASERKLRQELAALTETVEALREEIILLRGAAAGQHYHGCLCVHTYYPQPYTPPVQIWGYPQISCETVTATSGSSTVPYPGTITIN